MTTEQTESHIMLYCVRDLTGMNDFYKGKVCDAEKET